MARHLPALHRIERATEELRHVQRQRVTAHEHDAAFAQRREHPIAPFDAERRTDGDGFLARRRTVEADAALALQAEQPFVDAPQAQHLAIELVQGAASGVFCHSAQDGGQLFEQGLFLFVHARIRLQELTDGTQHVDALLA